MRIKNLLLNIIESTKEFSMEIIRLISYIIDISMFAYYIYKMFLAINNGSVFEIIFCIIFFRFYWIPALYFIGLSKPLLLIPYFVFVFITHIIPESNIEENI